MLKFVFSKVISCETKKSTSEFMLKLKLKPKFVNSLVYDFVRLFVNIHTWKTCIQVHLNNCMYPNVQIYYLFWLPCLWAIILQLELLLLFI